MSRQLWTWVSAIFLAAWGCAGRPSAESALAQGNALLDGGEFAAAIPFYDEALSLEPRLVQAFNNRGLARAGLGDWEGAVQDYTAGIEIRADLPELHYNRGVARFRKGDLGEAVADLTQAIRLDPSYARAYAARGLVFSAGGDVATAQADLQKALELGSPEWRDRPLIEAELEKLVRKGQPRK